MEKQIGTVKHFFPHIPAAVVELKGELKIGDKIVVKSKGGEEKFRQVVESMQVNHKDIKSGKAGEEIALKVADKAKEGDLVYLEE
jgi:selenocysteine-specific translation elongation factor